MKKLLAYMINVLKFGFRTLSQSSRGEYNERTDEVNILRNEMLHGKMSPVNDRKNLMRDRKKIGDDMRRAASKIVLNNG